MADVFLLDGDTEEGFDEDNEFEFDAEGEPAAREDYASEENAEMKEEELPGFTDEKSEPNMFEQMSRQHQEQIDRLARQHQEQMNLLIEKLSAKPEPKEEDIPDPDLDTWEDPNKAVELKVRKELAEYDRTLKQQQEQMKRQAEFQAAINRTSQDTVTEFPELGKPGTKVRNIYDALAQKYQEPLLPFLIGCTAHYLANKQAAPQKQQEAQYRGAVQERSRQSRVKKAAMHSSGKTEKSHSVKSSDPEEIKAMQALGIISPAEQKAYLEHRKRMVG